MSTNSAIVRIPSRADRISHAAPHGLTELFAPYLADAHAERLVVAGFDHCLCLIAFAEARGDADRVNGVIPAVRKVLAPSATRYIVMAHSHVVGNAEPSSADIDATRHVVRFLRLANIKLLDHLIVCGDDWVSMDERALI
ncbi:MAG: JAB domain-containing protein [Sphingopyxis sp.]